MYTISQDSSGRKSSGLVNVMEDCYGIWDNSQEQNIINLTRQILNCYNCTGLLIYQNILLILTID